MMIGRMTEQPAPYRPNPTLKRVETGFESLLFNSRWLLAPFYIGLVFRARVLLLFPLHHGVRAFRVGNLEMPASAK